MLNNQFFKFRLISYLERVSYLILVFIAMPLKYLEENSVIIKVAGMIHRLLFILFCISLITDSKIWSIKKDKAISYFIYSLISFSFLLIENALKERSNRFKE